jgi:small conductance mechanosensitive channel
MLEQLSVWLGQLWDRLLKDYNERFSMAFWSQFVQHLLSTLVILAVAVLGVYIVRAITRRAARVGHYGSALARRRAETVASLVYSVAKYGIYISCGLWILTCWGVDTQSLVVGSAVIGAAVGFGSQGLVQDVIVGLSILAEEQLAVGEYVEICGRTGVVEEVGLRVVKLRDPLGVQHVIFNRTIAMVSNYGGHSLDALVDVGVSGRETIDRVRETVLKAGTELAGELPFYLGAPHEVGLIENSVGEIYLRFRVRILPQRDSMLQEQLLPRLRKALAMAGLALPDDRIRVVVVGERFRQIVERVNTTQAMHAVK